jgi:hypothetical protein
MTTTRIILIVIGVVLALSLLAALFVGVIVGVAFYQIGNSQAASKAKDFLRSSEKLKAEIGEIKDFGSIVTGSVNVVNDSGEATINLKVIGARKTVNATVHLLFVGASTWRVSSASYVNETGQTINLFDPYDSKILIPRLIA